MIDLFAAVFHIRIATSACRRAASISAATPGERLHAQFIEKGGRFFVCPICFNDRSLDEAELVESAELKGATPLMEFAGDSAMTFTY